MAELGHDLGGIGPQDIPTYFVDGDTVDYSKIFDPGTMTGVKATFPTSPTLQTSFKKQLKQIDPQQVLSRQAQLDVANQLAAQQLYPQAAEAYELFLRHYPKFEQIEQVELMLGLIYARYLAQYDRAKGCLLKAIARLHGERELSMARAELARIEPLMAAGPVSPAGPASG